MKINTSLKHLLLKITRKGRSWKAILVLPHKREEDKSPLKTSHYMRHIFMTERAELPHRIYSIRS